MEAFSDLLEDDIKSLSQIADFVVIFVDVLLINDHEASVASLDLFHFELHFLDRILKRVLIGVGVILVQVSNGVPDAALELCQPSLMAADHVLAGWYVNYVSPLRIGHGCCIVVEVD